MNIVLLGAPGSGKGTQAEMITSEFGLFHLQTGEIARNLAQKDKRIQEIVASGKLIPEEEMTMYVIDFLRDRGEKLTNILFEGFPRFVSQYEALENFLRLKGDDIDLVISLDVSQEEAVRRISSRRICTDCGRVYNLITNPPSGDLDHCECGGGLVQREDDNPEAIKTRFQYYEKNTKELMNVLEKREKLFRVNGERPINEIFEDMKKAINNLNGKN